jgi:hypothetical protein
MRGHDPVYILIRVVPKTIILEGGQGRLLGLLDSGGHDRGSFEISIGLEVYERNMLSCFSLYVFAFASTKFLYLCLFGRKFYVFLFVFS